MKESRRDWALFATVLIAVVVLVGALALVGRGGTSTTASGPPSASTRVAISSPIPSWKPTTSPAAATTPSATVTLPTQTYPGTLLITHISEPDRNYDVCLVRSDGTGFRRLTHGSGNEEHAYWSPDGTRIVYGGPGIKVMNADGSGKVRVGDGGSPCWSPDGTQILYEDGDGLSVMNADGSDPQSLGVPQSSRYATWAPNGAIVFVRVRQAPSGGNRYPGGDLYAVHPDGTGLVRLTRHAGMILPSVSPDGSTIAAYVPKMDRIIAVPYRAYGPAVTLLAGASRYFPNGGMPIAHWTSDGKKLVVGSSNFGEDGGARLYIVNADGSGLTRVPGVTQAIGPDWRPAGASPKPAVTYPQPPVGGSMDMSAFTLGWAFRPTLDIEVTDLGYVDPAQDGLVNAHRVGIFDAVTDRLIVSVTVGPRSALDGFFRWESLEAPAVLRAGHSYLAAAVYRNGDEVRDGEPMWAPAVGHMRTAGRHFTSATSTSSLTADSLTAPHHEAVWEGFMAPNFKFRPASAASPRP